MLLTRAWSTSIDYEGELAVVIGRTCRNVPASGALDCVFGYSILNDLTARDRQRMHSQWFLGKSHDGFAPMGPFIVTADEPGDIIATGTASGVGQGFDPPRFLKDGDRASIAISGLGSLDVHVSLAT